MVESREHLEQPDGQPKKLITGEAREMRQEFVRRGNPVDTCGRSYGSFSVDRSGRRQSPGTVTPGTNFGWDGILYPTLVPLLSSSIFE